VRAALNEHWTQFQEPEIVEAETGVILTVWGMESPLLGETPVVPYTMELANDEIDDVSDQHLQRMIDAGFLYLFDGDIYDDPDILPRSVRPTDEDEDEDEE
jgi:hypothetical protein